MTKKIRHELTLSLNSATSTGDKAGRVTLTPANYSGTVTWYLEIIASVTGNSTFNLHDSSNNVVATVSLTSAECGGNYVRKRAQFSSNPSAGVHHLNVSAITGTCSAARIIAIQEVTDGITASESNIEIGGYMSTTSTSYTPVIPAHYYTYDSSKWNGSVSVYLEAMCNSNNASGVCYVQLEEDDGSFANWAAVTGSAVNATGTGYNLVRSSALTLTNGRHYRIALKTNSGYTAYSRLAKLVFVQTGTITKLEEQYNLFNASADLATGLQSKNTYWDSSEWTNMTNEYKFTHHSDNASNSTKLVDVTADPDADITNASVTGNNQQISSAFTMPTTGHELDFNVTNSTGTASGASIIVYASAAVDNRNGSVAISHSNSTSATGKKAAKGTSPITGSNSMSATGKKAAKGTSAISGSSSNSAIGKKGAKASAALSATSGGSVSYTVDKTIRKYGTVAITGSAGLNVLGRKSARAPPVGLSGSSGTSASGRKNGKTAVTLSATSGGSSTVKKGAKGSSSLSATAGGSDTGKKNGKTAVTLSGSSGISVSGRVNDSVNITATSGISVSGRKNAKGTAPVAGTVGGSVSVKKNAANAVSITGTVGGSAAGRKNAKGNSQITGSGVVFTAGRKGGKASVQISGSGSVSVTAKKSARGTVSISGSVGGSSTGRKGGKAAVSFTAADGMSASVKKNGKTTVQISGSVGGSGSGQKHGQAGVTLSATSGGSVTGRNSVNVNGSVAITGTSGGSVSGHNDIAELNVYKIKTFDNMILKEVEIMSTVSGSTVTAYQGETVRIRVSVLDSDTGSASDLSGFSAVFAYAQKSKVETEKVCTIDGNVVSVTLTAAESALLEDNYRYKFEITDGTTTMIVVGALIIEEV